MRFILHGRKSWELYDRRFEYDRKNYQDARIIGLRETCKSLIGPQNVRLNQVQYFGLCYSLHRRRQQSGGRDSLWNCWLLANPALAQERIREDSLYN